MSKADELLEKLNLYIATAHLDMGGNDKYTLLLGAHEVIKEIKVYLYERMINDKTINNDIQIS